MSEQPPFDPYNVNFFGHKLDPYRVIEIFRITDPALQQIVKKGLRWGGKHKTHAEDMADIISSGQRWQEMRREDAMHANQPELPFKPESRVINGHRIKRVDECTCDHHKHDCPTCDHGLDVCAVCGKAEAELDERCHGALVQGA